MYIYIYELYWIVRENIQVYSIRRDDEAFLKARPRSVIDAAEAAFSLTSHFI